MLFILPVHKGLYLAFGLSSFVEFCLARIIIASLNRGLIDPSSRDFYMRLMLLLGEDYPFFMGLFVTFIFAFSQHLFDR